MVRVQLDRDVERVKPRNRNAASADSLYVSPRELREQDGNWEESAVKSTRGYDNVLGRRFRFAIALV